ncbi:hypothetical protein EVB68_016 [Rhizobium phage RHph_Y2_6]|uniref:Uncharacterized protein n=1 Tax=Rhizobium phage RHph_Y2_6 TaxID=2509576 RepID=A0A7S5UV43_9CAUD|nr:hypothetical protein PP748_gp016 [Rhizobium phage RHph_Y2_6]QIG68753.1 hypothetical protein EVB68_016 [Rhizobium phage RHph_Y2_6]
MKIIFTVEIKNDELTLRQADYLAAAGQQRLEDLLDQTKFKDSYQIETEEYYEADDNHRIG